MDKAFMFHMDDFYLAIRERRRARAAAWLFADAVKEGDVDQFCKGVDAVARERDASLPAMRMVLRSPAARPSERFACSDAVQIPGRAAAASARSGCGRAGSQSPGFSGTTELDIAWRFADEKNQGLREAQEHKVCIDTDFSSSIVPQTAAPPDAIMLVHKTEEYYEQDRVVVDLFKVSRL